MAALTTIGNGNEPDMGRSSRVNPLQLLNVLRTKSSVHKGLMYDMVLVNGVQTKAMLDSGTTHNFVASREAKKLGLELVKDTSKIKAVNRKP